MSKAMMTNSREAVAARRARANTQGLPVRRLTAADLAAQKKSSAKAAARTYWMSFNAV